DELTSITPALADAPDDVSEMYADGCHQDQLSAEVVSCVYGDAESDTVVALVGDSHAAHWQPALEMLADEHGWRLETYTKSACLFAGVVVRDMNRETPYESCAQWQEDVLDQLVEQRPELVVASSSGTYRVAGDGGPLTREQSFEPVSEAMAERWGALEDAGIDVLTIADTPWWGTDVPECVAAHQDDLGACAVSREDAVARSGSPLHHAAAEMTPDAAIVDLTEYVCPGETCVPVVGGVLTHSDSHHLTATYVR